MVRPRALAAVATAWRNSAFQTTVVAIATQKDRPAALAFIKDFVERAKSDGTVWRAFDEAGLGGLPIAP
jgi:polar amino acid transport system substrate-binding protein